MRLARLLAAAGLLAGGYVHWHLWDHGYRYIPKIGVLFEINVVISIVAALAVLVRRDLIVLLGGIAVAIGTLAAFAGSRLPGGIFGFQERGLAPAPYALIALVAECSVIASLGYAIWRRSARPAAASATTARITQPIAR
jgi:hypothetical protein